MTWVNTETSKAGRIRVVCEICDRRSKYTDPVEPYPASRTRHLPQPDFWTIRGWSEAPFPDDYVHADGSSGSTFTCPACQRRMRTGAPLASVRGGTLQMLV